MLPCTCFRRELSQSGHYRSHLQLAEVHTIVFILPPLFRPAAGSLPRTNGSFDPSRTLPFSVPSFLSATLFRDSYRQGYLFIPRAIRRPEATYIAGKLATDRLHTGLGV